MKQAKKEEIMDKWIEPNEVAAIIAVANGSRDKALLALIYQLGLRRGEVKRITRDDYDGEAVEFTRLKSPDKRLRVRLWARTKKLLDEYLATRKDGMTPLFSTRVGTPMSGQMIYYIYRDAARKIGLPVPHQHPHTLRHSIAAHMSRAGMDITQIQELLGHTSAKGSVCYMAGARDPGRYNLDTTENSYHVASW